MNFNFSKTFFTLMLLLNETSFFAQDQDETNSFTDSSSETFARDSPPVASIDTYQYYMLGIAVLLIFYFFNKYEIIKKE